MADKVVAMTGVDTTHRQYDKFLEVWTRCRTVIEGEDAVKAAGQTYLPSLIGQESDKYKAYKMRAMFYEATGRTLQGMLGALHHEEPEMLSPTGKDDDKWFDALVPVHMPFHSYLRDVSEEVLTTGRIGVLVDIPKETSSNVRATPYFSSYCAEDIINWRTSFKDGKEILTLVVLREEVEEVSHFKTNYVRQWRVLELVDGFYEQTVYQKDEKTKMFFIVDGYPINPTKMGKKLERIPFYIINCGGNSTYVYNPPLLPLANVNLSHYRNSADLEHGRHYTGLPTPWVAGFSAEAGALYMGSEKAWVSSEPNAKAGFLEFTGQGLKTLETALEQKQALMAILGARMLEAPKNVSESVDNQVVKRSSENSILANIAETISQGMTEACKCAADWLGESPDKICVKIETEYFDIPADPQMMAQLAASLQSGAISYETFFYNMKRMKVVPEERTLEEEQDMIDKGKFGGLSYDESMLGALPVDPAEDDPEDDEPVAPAPRKKKSKPVTEE